MSPTMRTWSRAAGVRFGGACLASLLALSSLPAATALTVEDAALPKLHAVFQDHFLVGVSLDRTELPDKNDSGPNRDLLAHFNAMTAEDNMKWEGLQPTEGNFTFEASDALVSYAEEHNKSFTGHALVWHQQTPDWVFKDAEGNPASRDLVIARMRNHIHVVMDHFRGRVTGWDVVNEALSDLPWEYLRDSPWKRTIGDDYVALAFKFAREADPNVKLYYNDYAIEYRHKREKMIRLVKEIQDAGVTLDAVNIQGHFSVDTPSISDIEATIQAIVDLGLRTSISELDVSMFKFFEIGNPYAEAAPTELLEKQAQRYAELFALFLKHKAVIDRVTFWNLHDGLSWLNNHPIPGRSDYPLLFDREGKPKPAFFRVIEAARP